MLAVDAMGGDYAPEAVVEGALRAARSGVPLILFGDKARLVHLLHKFDSSWTALPIAIEDCSDAIAMDEEPTRAVLKKTDSSLVRAARAVNEGRASALISAGNSGALLVATIFNIGRVEGVLRPAFGGFLPGRNGRYFVIDLGANVDCRPEFLEQFAHMGALYLSLVANLSHPRVALLSNGHEPYKGSSLIKESYALLEKSALNFVGNKEARDLCNDDIDILVCDGFTGNILLKAMQGMAKTIVHWIKDEAERSLINRLRALFSRPLFEPLRSKSDYARIGGALLLGVKKPVIVAHGSSDAYAVENALKFAQSVVADDRIARFNHQLSDIIKNLEQKADDIVPANQMAGKVLNGQGNGLQNHS